MAILRSPYGSGGRSKIWAMPCRPSVSMSSTFRPPCARASARAAATVVLPVPPLPVTTCSRTPSQSVSLVVMPLLPPVVLSHGGYLRSDTSWFGGRRPTYDPFVTTLGSRKRGDPGGCSFRRHRDPGIARDNRGRALAQGDTAVREGHRLPVRAGPARDTRPGAACHPADRRQDGQGQHADRRHGRARSGGYYQGQRNRPGRRGGVLPRGGPDQGHRERAELHVRRLPAGADLAALDHRPVRDG